jgi:hypothetical protein
MSSSGLYCLLYPQTAVSLFFLLLVIHFHTIAPVLAKFRIMVEDTLGKFQTLGNVHKLRYRTADFPITSSVEDVGFNAWIWGNSRVSVPLQVHGRSSITPSTVARLG